MIDGAVVRARREGLGFSQMEVAEKVGVSQAMINRVEQGSKEPPLWLAVAIARLYGCTVDELLREA